MNWLTGTLAGLKKHLGIPARALLRSAKDFKHH
jgi:hypothetical protein